MTENVQERDLIGYGGSPPRIAWPNGTRLAVSVVVNFEEGAEWQVGDGDARSEAVGEVLSVVPPGARDLGQEQIFAYGMRVGFWRFLEALDRYHIPATFFCCGRAIERAPGLAKEIVERGHEPACHGWRWRPHADYADEAAERVDIERCLQVTEAATGERPEGFFCRGSESPWTRKLLAELGFTYASNAFDDDLPYDDPTGLVVLPYALDSNDMKFFHPNGFARAKEFVGYVEDALAQLLAEAEHGRSALLNIGFHLRIAGRPARFRAVEAIFQALADLGDDIWLARRIDIARHYQRTRKGNLS
ncbi:MAG: polysaccharide deacetylase family protein [Pseudomonadota bacterium]